MRLRVRSITYLAEDINGYELVDPNGHDLPRFEAGAHIGVRLAADGDAVWRDYSLWNDPAERRRYCIAVLREKLGEASRLIHERSGSATRSRFRCRATISRSRTTPSTICCWPAASASRRSWR